MDKILQITKLFFFYFNANVQISVKLTTNHENNNLFTYSEETREPLASETEVRIQCAATLICICPPMISDQLIAKVAYGSSIV